MKSTIDLEGIRKEITPHEGEFLAQLVSLAEPEVVVEINLGIGTGTFYLARALQDQKKGVVYSIIPHDGVEALRGFEVKVIEAAPTEALRGWVLPIDLLFIDGDHRFKNTRENFFGWTPWVPTEGIVIFHDYPRRVGVTKVINEIVKPSNLWEELGQVQKLVAFRRKR